MTQAALPHLSRGGSIITTTSVTAYKGNPSLIDYSATKGAQYVARLLCVRAQSRCTRTPDAWMHAHFRVSFTYSLAQSPEVLEKGIRVNAVAPGPIWTPLIPSTFPRKCEGMHATARLRVRACNAAWRAQRRRSRCSARKCP